MEENPYAAPMSDCEEAPKTTMDHTFYVVSRTKFFVLYLMTFGFYSIYWNFRNWQLFKKKTHKELRPVFRALFSIFFTHALLREIDEANLRKSSPIGWNAQGWATLIVVVMVAAQILAGLSRPNIGFPVIDLLAFAVLLLEAFLVAEVQMVINTSCDDPMGSSNQRFTGWNILGMVLGGIYITLVLLALFLPSAS